MTPQLPQEAPKEQKELKRRQEIKRQELYALGKTGPGQGPAPEKSRTPTLSDVNVRQQELEGGYVPTKPEPTRDVTQINRGSSPPSGWKVSDKYASTPETGTIYQDDQGKIFVQVGTNQAGRVYMELEKAKKSTGYVDPVSLRQLKRDDPYLYGIYMTEGERGLKKAVSKRERDIKAIQQRQQEKQTRALNQLRKDDPYLHRVYMEAESEKKGTGQSAVDKALKKRETDIKAIKESAKSRLKVQELNLKAQSDEKIKQNVLNRLADYRSGNEYEVTYDIAKYLRDNQDAPSADKELETIFTPEDIKQAKEYNYRYLGIGAPDYKSWDKFQKDYFKEQGWKTTGITDVNEYKDRLNIAHKEYDKIYAAPMTWYEYKSNYFEDKGWNLSTKAVHENPDDYYKKASEARQSYISKFGTAPIVIETLNEISDIAVPGYYVTRQWQTLSPAEKAINIAIDTVFVAAILGMPLKAPLRALNKVVVKPTARTMENLANRIAIGVSRGESKIIEPLAREMIKTGNKLRNLGQIRAGDTMIQKGQALLKNSNEITELARYKAANPTFKRAFDDLLKSVRGETGFLEIERRQSKTITRRVQLDELPITRKEAAELGLSDDELLELWEKSGRDKLKFLREIEKLKGYKSIIDKSKAKVAAKEKLKIEEPYKEVGPTIKRKPYYKPKPKPKEGKRPLKSTEIEQDYLDKKAADFNRRWEERAKRLRREEWERATKAKGKGKAWEKRQAEIALAVAIKQKEKLISDIEAIQRAKEYTLTQPLVKTILKQKTITDVEPVYELLRKTETEPETELQRLTETDIELMLKQKTDTKTETKTKPLEQPREEFKEGTKPELEQKEIIDEGQQQFIPFPKLKTGKQPTKPDFKETKKTIDGEGRIIIPPPPPPDKTDKKYKKPRIKIPGTGNGKKEWTPAEIDSAIAWKDGFVIHAIKSPYRRGVNERTYHVDNVPAGLKLITTYKGPGSQQRSAKVLGKAIPQRITVDVGNQDVIISKPKGQSLRIKHRLDKGTVTRSQLTVKRNKNISKKRGRVYHTRDGSSTIISRRALKSVRSIF